MAGLGSIGLISHAFNKYSVMGGLQKNVFAQGPMRKDGYNNTVGNIT